VDVGEEEGVVEVVLVLKVVEVVVIAGTGVVEVVLVVVLVGTITVEADPLL